MVLICISLMKSDAEYLFMYLLVICMSSLKENVYSELLPSFSLDYLCFLLLSCMSLWMFITYNICNLQIICPVL